jgi:hypothetical protein
LFRKRYKDLLAFVGTAMLASVGLYMFFALREPRMISQMLALTPGIRDVSGCFKLMLTAISEPVILLALAALPLVVGRHWPRWGLLLLYATMSFTVAGLADIQAGGNINYFFEGVFAVIPLAALGVIRLIAWSRRQAGLALFVAGLAAIHFFLPSLRAMSWQRSAINPRAVTSQNELYRKIEVALRDRHVFSAVPRFALMDPHPPLVEPYLLSYLRRLGKFDSKPLVERIGNNEFDVVITSASRDTSWRGISQLEGPEFASAIASAYKPYCIVLGAVFSLPRNLSDDNSLAQKLRGLGCTTINANPAP